MTTGIDTRTHYEVLGVHPGAAPEVVRAAYRAMTRKHHPDLHPADTTAKEMVARINVAYDVLSDEEARRRYDETLHRQDAAPGPAGDSAAGPPAWDGEQQVVLDDDNLDERVVDNHDRQAAPSTDAPTADAPTADPAAGGDTRDEFIKAARIAAVCTVIGVAYWTVSAVKSANTNTPHGVGNAAETAAFLGFVCFPLVLVGILRQGRVRRRRRLGNVALPLVTPLLTMAGAGGIVAAIARRKDARDMTAAAEEPAYRRSVAAGLCLVLLTGGALIAAVAGWQAWRGGVTWMPWNPAVVMATYAGATWSGRRAWQQVLRARRERQSGWA